MGSSLNGSVYGLALQGNYIIAGGGFTQAGILGVDKIARWDTVGQTWSNLGSGTDSTILALATTPNLVYAGGYFANAGGKPSAFVGRWGQFRLSLYLPLILR
jgi:hypothetical protein